MEVQYFKFKDLLDQIKAAGLKSNREFITTLEKEGIISKPFASLPHKTQNPTRIYTQEVINKIIEEVRAYLQDNSKKTL